MLRTFIEVNNVPVYILDLVVCLFLTFLISLFAFSRSTFVLPLPFSPMMNCIICRFLLIFGIGSCKCSEISINDCPLKFKNCSSNKLKQVHPEISSSSLAGKRKDLGHIDIQLFFIL